MSARRFRLVGDSAPPMTEADLLYAARIAFDGGLLPHMPATADAAIDAFEDIEIPVEEVEE